MAFGEAAAIAARIARQKAGQEAAIRAAREAAKRAAELAREAAKEAATKQAQLRTQEAVRQAARQNSQDAINRAQQAGRQNRENIERIMRLAEGPPVRSPAIRTPQPRRAPGQGQRRAFSTGPGRPAPKPGTESFDMLMKRLKELTTHIKYLQMTPAKQELMEIIQVLIKNPKMSLYQLTAMGLMLTAIGEIIISKAGKLKGAYESTQSVMIHVLEELFDLDMDRTGFEQLASGGIFEVVGDAFKDLLDEFEMTIQKDWEAQRQDAAALGESLSPVPTVKVGQYKILVKEKKQAIHAKLLEQARAKRSLRQVPVVGSLLGALTDALYTVSDFELKDIVRRNPEMHKDYLDYQLCLRLEESLSKKKNDTEVTLTSSVVRSYRREALRHIAQLPDFVSSEAFMQNIQDLHHGITASSHSPEEYRELLAQRDELFDVMRNVGADADLGLYNASFYRLSWAIDQINLILEADVVARHGAVTIELEAINHRLADVNGRLSIVRDNMQSVSSSSIAPRDLEAARSQLTQINELMLEADRLVADYRALQTTADRLNQELHRQNAPIGGRRRNLCQDGLLSRTERLANTLESAQQRLEDGHNRRDRIENLGTLGGSLVNQVAHHDMAVLNERAEAAVQSRQAAEHEQASLQQETLRLSSLPTPWSK